MIRHSLAALAVICMVAPAQAQTSEPATISVNGEATISVPPDLAQIDGGVTTTAKTAREASEANNKTMGVVLLALKNAGIAEKDFQTSRLSLQPETSTRTSGGPTQIIGYRASNRVTVTIRDTGKLANVIDTLVGNGANDISGISFSVSNTSKLLDEARVEALADARRKAEIYARAAGVTLGAPLSISESGGAVPITYRRAAAPMAAAPIAQGEETLRIGVAVSYEIKPKAQ
ncbi:MAG: SIMPL domain-containing protein [Afipia sp.]|nr:SIMPL domain-containing protein [Afipia sp.]OJW63097.1 MAG: SIMPL domain-containing protein [Afipia sp. 64-13]